MSLVVPVYNEESALDPFLKEIDAVFSAHPEIVLEIIFVNDGSTDTTLERLLRLKESDSRISVIDLSRNFGKEAALTAGLDKADGDVVVPIDVDLQDPPNVIFEMLDKWRQGYDVVLGRRSDRSSDSRAKRWSALLFYRLHNLSADYPIPENVGDFRLMDKRVVAAIRLMHESRRFMKGLFAWVGFRATSVDYVRNPRAAGSGKFNGWKLWNFALEGITGFGTVPLRVWTYVGGSVALFSVCFAIYRIVKVMLYGIDVPGYASTITAICFLGGLQLMGIGILGEYLGRTYVETKRRPVYLVRETYSAEATDSSRPEGSL